MHYAQEFLERVERMALMAPSMFPDLKPFFLVELLRKPLIGDLMAPVISLAFWKYAIQSTLDWDENLNGAVEESFSRSVCRFARNVAFDVCVALGQSGRSAPFDSEHSAGTLPANASFSRIGGSGGTGSFCATCGTPLIPDSEVVVLDSGHFFPISES